MRVRGVDGGWKGGRDAGVGLRGVDGDLGVD